VPPGTRDPRDRRRLVHGIRLLSGAIALAILAAATRPPGEARVGGSWASAAALFAYAAAFSYAYLRLEAGAGALILFASVQVTMIGWAGFAASGPGFSSGSDSRSRWAA